MQAKKKCINGIGLCIVVAVACLLVISNCQAQGQGADPVQPIKWCSWIEPLPAALDPEWNPSDCFVPAWDDVVLSTELRNPDENPDVEEIVSTQRLTVSVKLYEATCEGIISDLTFIRPYKVWAVDYQGDRFVADEPSSRLRHYSRPRESAPAAMADRAPRVSLYFPMDPAAGYPQLFSELGFSFYALTAEYIQSIELPFRAFDQWIEILPDYKLKIEEAVSEDKRFSYRFVFQYTGEEEGQKPSMHISMRENEPLPRYWDLGLKLLNAEGKDVFEVDAPDSGGSSRGTSGHGSLDLYTATGHGECGGCGAVETIVFRYAVNPAEVELSYVLNDIPVPSFATSSAGARGRR